MRKARVPTRVRPVMFRLTPGEYEQIRIAADAAGKTLSVYLRSLVLQPKKDELGEIGKKLDELQKGVDKLADAELRARGAAG
jgi:hypothetical protein